MKQYVKPMMESEVFTANEYISSCWGVACDTDAAENWELKHSTWKIHQKSECGNASHQMLVDIDNDGSADKMIEDRGGLIGNLNCTLYSDTSYTNPIKVSDVKPGDNIYWTTKVGLLTYHHQGEVYSTVPGHPNRS